MAWSILGICLLALSLPMTGNDDSPDSSTPPLLALPHAGAPISFQQSSEVSSTNPGGTPVAKISTTSVYRDSAGRLLIRGEISQGPNATAAPYFDLWDPVNRSRVFVFVAEEIGYRFPLPKSGDANFFVSCADKSVSSDDWITTTQKLGTRTIEGITFEGMRFSQTSKLANTVNTREQWYSEDLKLFSSVVVSCGNRTWSTRIQKLRREEPDPSLFIIPAKYKILDQEIHFNQQ